MPAETVLILEQGGIIELEHQNSRLSIDAYYKQPQKILVPRMFISVCKMGFYLVLQSSFFGKLFLTGCSKFDSGW